MPKSLNSPITIINPKTEESKTIAPSDNTDKITKQYTKSGKYKGKQEEETEKFSINGYCFIVPKK